MKNLSRLECVTRVLNVQVMRVAEIRSKIKFKRLLLISIRFRGCKRYVLLHPPPPKMDFTSSTTENGQFVKIRKMSATEVSLVTNNKRLPTPTTLDTNVTLEFEVDSRSGR